MSLKGFLTSGVSGVAGDDLFPLLTLLNASSAAAGPVAYIRADEAKRIFGYVRAVETIQ